MATDEPRRDVIKRLKKAGFELVNTDGKHDKWKHPSGPWVPVPRHRMISPAVVRTVDKAIAEAQARSN